MFKKLLGKSESSRLIRRYKSGSLPIVAPAGTLRLDEVMWQACFPALTFMVVLICLIQKYRFANTDLTYGITAFLVVVLMAWPTTAVVVYSLGIWRTIRYSVARTSAVIFWMFWPFWRLAACVAAVVAATCVGNHIWYNYFRLHIEYGRLQSYDNVDAYTVTGNRMQDSGLVVFNETNGVDRAKSSCIFNGHTYCIAPILRGGAVKVGEQQSRTGINDLFMAGIDCCTCPDNVVTDFRCGDWDDSVGRLGGMRLLDDEHRKMYRLAAEKWEADYHKVTAHKIFFNWVNDPVVAWRHLWNRGFHLACLASIFGVFGSFLLMVVLNGFMKVLRDYKIAAPLDDEVPNMPALSIGGGQAFFNPVMKKESPLTKSFMPDEYRSYLGQYDPDGEPDPKFVIL